MKIQVYVIDACKIFFKWAAVLKSYPDSSKNSIVIFREGDERIGGALACIHPPFLLQPVELWFYMRKPYFINKKGFAIFPTENDYKTPLFNCPWGIFLTHKYIVNKFQTVQIYRTHYLNRVKKEKLKVRTEVKQTKPWLKM